MYYKAHAYNIYQISTLILYNFDTILLSLNQLWSYSVLENIVNNTLSFLPTLVLLAKEKTREIRWMDQYVLKTYQVQVYTFVTCMFYNFKQSLWRDLCNDTSLYVSYIKYRINERTLVVRLHITKLHQHILVKFSLTAIIPFSRPWKKKKKSCSQRFIRQ